MDHRHVVESLGHVGVEIEDLVVEIQSLLVIPIAGEHQGQCCKG